MKIPTIITITGPSGSGKTVLSKLLCQKGMGKLLVSATTRPPRLGEIDGVDYYFLSEPDFLKKKELGEFLETAKYNGYWYGTLSSTVESICNRGVVAIKVVENQGVVSFQKYAKEKGWNIHSVFVANPTEVLVERVLNRLLDDVKDVTSPEIIREKVRLHTSRIIKITQQEFKEMVDPAFAENSPFHYKVTEFNANVQEKVVSDIFSTLPRNSATKKVAL